MTPFVAELLGTALIIIFGDGVVANVLLKNSKGNNGGWIVIAFGWAMAVFIAVYVSAAASGAHLNPAVTLALAYLGKFDWSLVPGYLLAQLLGGMLGALLVWAVYRQHYDATEDPDLQLATFCTGPAIRNYPQNFLTELLATFIFVIAILFISKPMDASGLAFGLGALDALPVALLVLGMGLSLGGPTGYAINPARDLGPRIMHFILPIKGKRDSDWAYSWVPVLGPIAGALLAAWVFQTFLS
ncbi:MAG: aquaporin family protein [Chitinophagaceae bacterium]|nr:aquaporin family protein [Chitinophagaceae bacterium]